MPDNLVEFIRKRDYELVKELGQGACGKTVLLYDDMIDEHFVCKKYFPFSETHRQELYTNFVREIKLLHQVHHDNVVRVFNYYLYPDRYMGFILMEFIDGLTIIEWIRQQQKISAYKVRDIVAAVLKKCYDLDKIHLDHGELSRLDRHVLISEHDSVNIIDFESSSNLRKVSNVTSATQALLLNGVIAKRINGLLNIPKNEIIQISRLYKQKPTRHNFDRLIHIIQMA